MHIVLGFPGGAWYKEPAVNAGDVRDTGLRPGWGRFPGGGSGNPLQDSGESHGQRNWRDTVHGAAKSRTRLK